MSMVLRWTQVIKKDECKRQLIYKNKTAKEVKSFGGNEQKGCGKFIPIER